MLIRRATTEDFAEWLRMRLLLWPATVAEHEPEMRAWLEEQDKLLILVAERANKRLAGFLEAGIRDYAEDCESRNVGYIEGWFVDADVREQGVGRLLVRAAEAWALEKGCTEMASDCELGNEVSLAAHLKLGYEETARLIHFRKKL